MPKATEDSRIRRSANPAVPIVSCVTSFCVLPYDSHEVNLHAGCVDARHPSYGLSGALKGHPFLLAACATVGTVALFACAKWPFRTRSRKSDSSAADAPGPQRSTSDTSASTTTEDLSAADANAYDGDDEKAGEGEGEGCKMRVFDEDASVAAPVDTGVGRDVSVQVIPMDVAVREYSEAELNKFHDAVIAADDVFLAKRRICSFPGYSALAWWACQRALIRLWDRLLDLEIASSSTRDPAIKRKYQAVVADYRGRGFSS